MSIDSEVAPGEEPPALVAFAPDLDPVERAGPRESVLVELVVGPVEEADAVLVAAVRVLHFRSSTVEDAAVVVARPDGSFALASVHVENDTPLASVLSTSKILSKGPRILKDVQTAVAAAGCTTDTHDLTWALVQHQSALHCKVAYDAHKFSRPHVQLLASNVQTIFRAILQDPSLAAADVAFPDPLAQLAACDVAASFPEEKRSFRRGTIMEVFADVVAEHADKDAIVTGSLASHESLTYRQLDTLTSALARRIRAAIPALPAPSAPLFVACCIPPSPLALAVILAILKTGAAYVPLDIRLPEDRLRTLIADSKSCVLVTSADAPQVDLEAHIPRLDVSDFLDNHDASAAVSPEEYRASAPGPGSPAYVMYTSGSTGLPKGVCVAHGAVLALADPTSRGLHNFALDATHRVAQLNNLAWDGSVFDVFCTLLTGATLVSLDRYAVLDPPALARAFAAARVTTCFVTTSLFRTLLRGAPGAFSQLRTLLVGGESIDYDVYRELFAGNPGLALWNMYGPTETCCYTTAYRVPPLVPGQPGARDIRGLVPIGRPLDHTLCCVFDRERRLVPPGVVGELWIGGAGVALEYLARPKENAASFVELDVTLAGGAARTARFYRTGDLVKWRPDGEMQFMGRVSAGQIKIRGQRLELSEVEAALVKTGLVADAAVLYVPPAPGAEAHLSAYVVPSSGRAGEAAVRAALKKSAPAYMIPRRFAFMEALPLTNSGKCDRRMLQARDAEALRALEEQAAAEPVGITAPRDPVVHSADMVGTLCAAFASVVSERGAAPVRVGPDSDFFDIGGHSLLAMKLKWQIEAVLNGAGDGGAKAVLSVRDIFEHPTPRLLADFLGGMQGERDDAADALAGEWPFGVDLGEGQLVHPLSIGQLRVWQLVLTDNDPTANCPHWFRFDGPLDEDRLELALRLTFERHEVLRSVFEPDGDVDGIRGPVMRVLPDWKPELERVDVPADVAAAALGTGAPDWSAHSEGALGDLLRSYGNHLFALADGAPGVRLVLLRLAPTTHILLLNMSHIITDGYSRATHFRELAALYADPRPAALAPLPHQYGAFARWQRSAAFESAAARKIAHWAALVAPSTAAEFPASRPRTAEWEPSRAGALRVLACAPALVARLERVGRAERCSMFVLLVAALRLAHDRLTGGRTRGAAATPALGATAANRTLAAFGDVPGYFVNTHVYPIRIEAGDGAREVLRRVRGMAWDALANEDAPLPLYAAAAAARAGRDLARDPLLRVVMGYHQFDDAPVRAGGVEMRVLEVDMRLLRFDLQVFFTRHADGSMHGDFHYRAAMYDEAAAERIVRTYEEVLEELAALA